MAEKWELVFRDGFAPHLSTAGLEALAKAIEEDDYRLLQGATTSPPPMQCVQDWEAEAACAIGFCGWQGEGLKTVADVEEFFGKRCFDCDMAIEEPAACRWFLNWADETPRAEMRRRLLPVVQDVLRQRQPKEVVA